MRRRTVSGTIGLIGLLMVGILFAGEPPHPLTGPVVKVIDGDTIDVELDGQRVRLELDVRHWDRYQRLLAYVYVGDVMINAELVRQGYAQVATFPPNVRYQSQFMDLQRAAREEKAGCWKTP
jgi:endonuclease YncB( thermonuclease family)